MCGCATTNKRLDTNASDLYFQKNENGFDYFLFLSFADAVYPENSEEAEMIRMEWLKSRLTELGYSQHGYEILDRNAIFQFKGLLGSVYWIDYFVKLNRDNKIPIDLKVKWRARHLSPLNENIWVRKSAKIIESIYSCRRESQKCEKFFSEMKSATNGLPFSSVAVTYFHIDKVETYFFPEEILILISNLLTYKRINDKWPINDDQFRSFLKIQGVKKYIVNEMYSSEFVEHTDLSNQAKIKLRSGQNFNLTVNSELNVDLINKNEIIRNGLIKFKNQRPLKVRCTGDSAERVITFDRLILSNINNIPDSFEWTDFQKRIIDRFYYLLEKY